MRLRIDTPARRTFDVALALAFLAFLAAPGAIGYFAPAPASNIEREFRRPSPKPAAPHSRDEWLAWPASFDAWYRDTFGLRATLIRWHNVAKLELFDVSPTNEIVAGPDHWLFTTRDRAVDVFRGVDPFTERELALWKQILEDRREWCAERGIAYVFAIAPNKETIYPERFPQRFDKVGPTRREQLVEFVARNSQFPLLDLTSTLLDAKAKYAPADVYFPLGTHWNDRGALAAYARLIERAHELVPAIPLHSEAEFEFVPTDFQDDSWAGRLYMEDLLVQRNVEAKMHFERGVPQELWDSKIHDRALAVDSATLGASLPRAVVFHDSMGEKLRPWIAENFSHVAFQWVSDFDTALIEKEKPAIVIQLFVERALAATSLSNSPLDTNERCEREFAASSQVLLPSSEALRDGVLTPNSTSKAPITVAHENGALRVGYGGGQMLLPELDVPRGTWPIVRLELESPADTSCMVEFLTRRFTDYSRNARSVQRPVTKGPNVVYIKLRVPDLVGRLRLQPGLVAGDYVIRSLEVRAVPE